MSKVIGCDVCGELIHVRHGDFTNKILIRDGAEISGKFLDFDLCNTCLKQVFSLFDSIRIDTELNSDS